MPKTNMFCAQCGEDKTESELFKLFAKKAPVEMIPIREFYYVGRYCGTCLPHEQNMEKSINGAVEFRIDPLSSAPIERK